MMSGYRNTTAIPISFPARMVARMVALFVLCGWLLLMEASAARTQPAEARQPPPHHVVSVSTPSHVALINSTLADYGKCSSIWALFTCTINWNHCNSPYSRAEAEYFWGSYGAKCYCHCCDPRNTKDCGWEYIIIMHACVEHSFVYHARTYTDEGHLMMSDV